VALALHPFLTGHPHRAKRIDKALEHIAGHDGVWLTTGAEIAAWYYEHYYDWAPN
jgi:allantoinase